MNEPNRCACGSWTYDKENCKVCAKINALSV